MPLSVGDKLGPYEILAPIGAGGMGEVYRARDTRLQREVAIKVSQERFSDRFEREARAVAALNHPNICQIYDVGPNYLVMELIDGARVAPPDSPRKLLDLAAQMADGIAAAHAANLVHRDLKPDNILVTRDGRVKILDFGLAKATGVASGPEDVTHTANPTKPGTTVGTVAYMSPEQARGDVCLRAQSDQFSFGLVLYEMAAGKRAFIRGSTAETMAAIIREDAAPLPASVPAPLRWTIERLLSKDPAERYDTTGDLYRELKHVREHLSESSVSGEQAAQPAAPRPRVRRLRVATLAALSASCVGAAFFLGQRFPATKAAEPQWKLTQLTRETGLSQSPALSPDGKLVAYSWDGADDGQFDIYVKQVAGGPPIRLTTDGAGNDSPDFSPDGSRIVFHSDRDGGGIFEVPSFGGQVRLITRGGRNPKYSPDGAQVAFWVGNPHVAEAVPGSGAVLVAPVAGGQARRIEGLTAAHYPVWSPDGKHLLVIGYTSAKAYESSALDWWVVDPGGGGAVKTGMRGAMLLAKVVPDPIRTAGSSVPVMPRPACWSAAGSMVTFARSPSLWQAGISLRTSKASGEFQRLTTGAGRETEPSCSASGALTFTTSESRENVWSAPLDMNRAVTTGPLEPVTRNLATHEYPSPSKDGRYMTFASDESGHWDIWRRDMSTGKETLVSESSFAQRYPVIDAAGKRVAYSVYERDKRLIYLSTPGGLSEKLCEGCLRATDWSKDEKGLLIFGGGPYKISLLDLASHRQTLLVQHPSYHVLYGRFSPDNGWISFTVRTLQDRGRIAIARLDGPKPVGENAWITITEEGPEEWANWSPDGKTLFFVSMRDGHNCIWAQRLEAASHKPVGEAFAVQHLHGRLTYVDFGWSVGAGRIAVTLFEATGNVWMMSRTQAR